MSIGVEGYLEVLDDSVWAVYTDAGRKVYGVVHPDKAPLPEAELLWAATWNH